MSPKSLARHRRIGALCAALLMAVPPGPGHTQVRLPELGDAASQELPVGAERRYGDQIMAEVWRHPAYLDDPVLTEYVADLWAPLLETARRRGDIDDDVWRQFAWRTFLVQDRSVNAFALPGGYVGVHLGLLAMTANADELASVLAHELSHVSQRHIARGQASASRQGMASMVGVLLGVLVAARGGSPDLAQAAIVGSQAAAVQGQLNFSREMEREADRIGFGIFRAAGFGASGMSAMFEKLDQAGRLNDGVALPYLMTHPLTEERIAEARSRLVEPVRPSEDDVRHRMMQARARVLMDDTESAWRHHLAAAEGSTAVSSAQRAGLLYAATLSAIRMRAFDIAGRHLSALQREPAVAAGPDGVREAARLLQVDMLMAQGDPGPALRALGPLTASDSRPRLIARASAALQASPATGVELATIDAALRAWLSLHRDDAVIWTLHAQTAEALGSPFLAARAWAEALAARGDLRAAIDRLRAAQRRGRQAAGADLIDAAIVDARLRELEAVIARDRARGAPGTAPSERGPG